MYKNRKRNYLEKSIIFLVVLILISCSPKFKDNTFTLEDNSTALHISSPNFRFHFTNSDNDIDTKKDTISGLYLSGNPVVNTELIASSSSKNELAFSIKTSKGQEATVKVSLKDGVSKFEVIPNSDEHIRTSLQIAGMPVAHGLGDAGSYRESFNLIENKNKEYKIINDGERQRWTSTFVIFPKNKIAGVYFDEGQKKVTLSEQSYAMEIKKVGSTTFYYFLGDVADIYQNYKKIRNQEGFKDVKPKSRLFELGWESWDALGWNTNQQTVKEILKKFHDDDYPIRWAVTGSGFWETGGTTTSFGKWGEKFSDPVSFKSWMHTIDIKWMIGLRTNFVPDGGPYYPKTKKRNKNLKVKAFHGNNLSAIAQENGFLVTTANEVPFKITSSIFPIVPCYLLDGRIKGASQWYQKEYSKWDVDGIKEDTMMDLDSLTGIYNEPITEISKSNGLVMARNGNFTAPGTLLRMNDTGVGDLDRRIPINYFQYAASGFPNVYSDVVGVHNMHNIKDIDKNIRHTWLLSLTSGLAMGAFPSKWPMAKQEVFKKAIDLHYKLVPYMYSAAIEGYETGYPTTLTPMPIAYPHDNTAIHHHNYQWMIGESILATPLLKNHESGKMDVYLPKGIWYDYESGQKYEGPLTLEDYEIPLEKIPCFIGGKGAIVLRDSEDASLRAKIYPLSEQETSFLFNYPDGKTQSEITYKKWTVKDNIILTDVTLNEQIAFERDEKNGSISFKITPNHNYKIQLN